MTPENQFKQWLLEVNSDLQRDRIQRHAGETPVHLRLRPGCGFETPEHMTAFITEQGLDWQWDDCYSRTPDYRGHGITVTWQGTQIGMLLAVQQRGRVKRKELSPQNLGFDGKCYSNVQQFAADIRASIAHHIHREFLGSLIANIETGTPIMAATGIQPQDISRITSDFGEILAAFSSVCSGKTVEFPAVSNNAVADFVEDTVPVSVKNPKGGGKVNLSAYRDLIDTSTDTGRLLYAIANHDKAEFFAVAARVSPLIEKIAALVGGTSVESVQCWVAKTDYHDFYNLIRSWPECKMLGIPDPGRAEALWKQHSTEPFYFTINTLLNRCWGQSRDNGVSAVVRAFLTRPVFKRVNIVGENVVFETVRFDSVEHWGTCYWSRATAAWHNWMGVQPLKEP